eukprot:529013_1
MDLNALIKTFNVLNMDKERSTLSTEALISHKNTNNKLFVVSDADEEMLILVEFAKIVDLHSVKLHSLHETDNDNDDCSPPKAVHILKRDNIAINFDDINPQKLDKSMLCKCKKSGKSNKQMNTFNAKKKSNKFNKTKYLAIYIQSNQTNTTNTYFNSIEFKGNCDDKHQDSKMVINDVTPTETYNLVYTKQQYKFNKRHSKNMMQLNNFITELKQISDTSLSTTDNNPNSMYMLNPDILHSDVLREKKLRDYLSLEKCKFIPINSNCKLRECPSFKVICSILNTYKLCYNENLDENIDNTNLLNHFNHLLFDHSAEFDEIYDELIKLTNPCIVTTCLMIKRNNRNRHRINQEMYFGDVKNVVTQQMLDRMHSYYFHSFDIGYRLQQTEKKYIMKNEMKENDDNKERTDVVIHNLRNLIKTKKTLCANIPDLERLSNTDNKFTYNINEYQYGQRYFYWEYYKKNTDFQDEAHRESINNCGTTLAANDGSQLKDWYITKKYMSFKEELLLNKICTISISNWLHLKLKAQAHENTNLVRRMECPRRDTAKLYDMLRHQRFSIHHLISIMVYCNYDKLQREFTMSFRHKNETETDQEMK